MGAGEEGIGKPGQAEDEGPEGPGRARAEIEVGLDARLHPRIARARLADVVDYQAHLACARRSLMRLGEDAREVDALLRAARGQMDRYAALAEGRIEPRRRPPVQRPWGEHDPPRRRFLMFLDECGSHRINPRGDPFPAFGLCGVIVDEERHLSFDRAWKRWKALHLGTPGFLMHEPEVRKREGAFYRADGEEQLVLVASLDEQLRDLEFAVIAAVIHKPDFAAMYGDDAVDEFLPKDQYLMCLDFVMERFVHFLYHRGEDASGRVYAEARGALEDAQVQQEYIRLQIEGTQYLSASWFRYQLETFVQFVRKGRNDTGLQIADLAARPCAEKVLRPATEPERWTTVRGKLYDGGAGRPESYGLKSFPTGAAWAVLGEKADGDALAPPPAD